MFSILAKPAGVACNLECRYCFYLEKERLYRGSTFRMREQVLEAFIRQLCLTHPGPDVDLVWQGGEPTLMGLDFFRRVVELSGSHRRPGTRIRHGLQTNGLLLDDRWCAFLEEHGFLVGLSLDGPGAMHDAYRVDHRGQGTHARVVASLARLQRAGVQVNILTAVHAANADHPLEVYRFLRDRAGARFLQLIPVVERRGSAVSDRSVRPDQWGRFLIQIFEEWVSRDVGQVFVQAFDAALASHLGRPTGVCVFEPRCGRALALEHNGDLYPCDHFVTPRHGLGNVTRSDLGALLRSAALRDFGDRKESALPGRCRACPVLFACRGECPRNRFLSTPEGEPGLNYLCDGYRAFFEHVDRPMQRMAGLLRQRRAPAEVMRLTERPGT